MTDEQKAAEKLCQGKIVAFPTETVYGLGADYLNEAALQALYSLKKRPKDKSFILHVSSVEQSELVAEELPEIFFRLAKRFWPGPLTLVVKKKRGVMDGYSQNDTIAIRMPKSETAKRFIEAVGYPIAGTSANISGCAPALSLSEVKALFPTGIDFFLNGPSSALKMPSTILTLAQPNLKILREGSIKRVALEKELGCQIF